ncbi:MAG: diguanylate phosphodiesterase, partial [Christensenellaceae bacterium]
MIEWNITAEAISMIVVAILLVYSFSNQNLRTYKSIVFNACLIVTFLAIMFDIVSVFSIQNYKILPISFTYIVTLFYFLLTPLMSVMFCIYSLTLAYEGHPNLKKIMAFILIPYLIYAAFVFLNPITNGIFTLDAVNGYARA